MYLGEESLIGQVLSYMYNRLDVEEFGSQGGRGVVNRFCPTNMSRGTCTSRWWGCCKALSPTFNVEGCRKARGLGCCKVTL